MAAAVGVGSQALHQPGHLVHRAPVRGGPRAPLLAVDRAEVAGLGVGPLVPDRDAARLQPAHIGVSAQEPDQLGHHRLPVHLLGGEQGKAAGEVEADLPAEHAQRARVGPVVTAHPVGQDFGHQIEVGALRGRGVDRRSQEGVGVHGDGLVSGPIISA